MRKKRGKTVRWDVNYDAIYKKTKRVRKKNGT